MKTYVTRRARGWGSVLLRGGCTLHEHRRDSNASEESEESRQGAPCFFEGLATGGVTGAVDGAAAATG
jgi:hypothetical protein